MKHETRWKGVPLSELSREGLVEAVEWLSRELERTRPTDEEQEARRDREVRASLRGQELAWLSRMRRRQDAR